jgi:putative zinc finger/helix-turn-helix YgiT family protein
MGKRRRCTACGHGPLEAGIERLAFSFPRCGVAASVLAPARRCPGCGAVHVDEAVRARAPLVLCRALADAGVHSGETLRFTRKALALRAADLARLLGVTPETVSHWETGKASPPRAAFAAICALVEDAAAGRTLTRDRLEALARARPGPRALTVALR